MNNAVLNPDTKQVTTKVLDLFEAGFGNIKKDVLELSPEETAYLIDKGKIVLTDGGVVISFEDFFLTATAFNKGFDLRYIVYKDLKERGYHLLPGVVDFRVYPRGGRPGKTPPVYYVHVVSERLPLDLQDLTANLNKVANLRKRLILAIVDEESDLTYYEMRAKEMGEKPLSFDVGEVIRAHFLEDRVVIFDKAGAETLDECGFFGKKLDLDRMQLSLMEAIYLIQKGILEVESQGFESLFQIAEGIEEGFSNKYSVYKDLRDRGLIAKTGFKFGSHFRVYDNLTVEGRPMHSKYLVHSITNDFRFVLPELSRAVRIAHTVRKKMIFGFAHKKEKGINYIEIRRVKL